LEVRVSQGTTHDHAAQHRLFFDDQALHSSSKPVQGNSTIVKSQKSPLVNAIKRHEKKKQQPLNFSSTVLNHNQALLVKIITPNLNQPSRERVSGLQRRVLIN
jgi:hypothetical protein